MCRMRVDGELLARFYLLRSSRMSFLRQLHRLKEMFPTYQLRVESNFPLECKCRCDCFTDLTAIKAVCCVYGRSECGFIQQRFDLGISVSESMNCVFHDRADRSGFRQRNVHDEVASGLKCTVNRSGKVAGSNEEEVWMSFSKMIQLNQSRIGGSVDINGI